MRKILISRRGIRGVSVVACAAALAASLTFGATAFAEGAQDSAFGEPVVAIVEPSDGVSAGVGAAVGEESAEPEAQMSDEAVAVGGTGEAGDASDGSLSGADSDAVPTADSDAGFAAVTGWATGADGARHWYDEGVMAADKAFYDPGTDAWYWADADGSIARDKDVFIPVSNEDRSSGKWVRFDGQCRMVKGEDCRYGGWYLFDEVTGEMAKGFRFVEANGGKWVCYDRVNGQMHHGQAADGGHWYLFDEYTGATLYGFQYIASDGKWVFYDRTMGWMLYGEQAIDGNWYYLDPNTGAVTYGWCALSDGRQVYYDTMLGIMKYGSQNIDGCWYWFDQETGALDRQAAVNMLMSTANSLLGVPYVWLGVYPQDGGMDCASFTWYVYKQLGIDIGFETYDQMNSGFHVNSLAEAQPGDLILMYYGAWPNYNPSLPEHVVLYAGNGMIYEEPTFGGQCQHVTLSEKNATQIEIRRILAD